MGISKLLLWSADNGTFFLAGGLNTDIWVAAAGAWNAGSRGWGVSYEVHAASTARIVL